MTCASTTAMLGSTAGWCCPEGEFVVRSSSGTLIWRMYDAAFSTFLGLAGLSIDARSLERSLLGSADVITSRWASGSTSAFQTSCGVSAGMTQVAEGIRTAKSAHDLAGKLQVEIPLHDAVYRILHEGLPVQKAMSQLLSRELKSEFSLH